MTSATRSLQGLTDSDSLYDTGPCREKWHFQPREPVLPTDLSHPPVRSPLSLLCAPFHRSNQIAFLPSLSAIFLCMSESPNETLWSHLMWSMNATTRQRNQRGIQAQHRDRTAKKEGITKLTAVLSASGRMLSMTPRPEVGSTLPLFLSPALTGSACKIYCTSLVSASTLASSRRLVQGGKLTVKPKYDHLRRICVLVMSRQRQIMVTSA